MQMQKEANENPPQYPSTQYDVPPRDDEVGHYGQLNIGPVLKELNF